MKIGFRLVLFALVLNLISGLIYSLSVPGTEYVVGTTATGDAEDYAERFDPEELMNNTQSNILLDIPYLGGIVAGLMPLWNGIKFVVIGFPELLFSYAGYLPDGTARSVFNSLVWMILGVFNFIIFGWVFQVLTGRATQD